jgi:transcriptional regulator GlxA family with amidase domain
VSDTVSLKELLLAYLEWCYSHKEQPRTEEFARRIGISRDTLHQWCMKEIGCSPSTLIREERLLYAEELLTRSDLTTNDVAYRAAFGTRGNLFRAFRRQRRRPPRSTRT